jgi:serine/threonine protein kinase
MEGLRAEDPQRVGRYRLLKRLGTGGMGQVYLGQSPGGRLVAVKIIRAELADHANFRQRFRQEVKAARRVSGIFTAPVVDADPDAPQPWMVTAYVAGPSLAEAVASRGPMPVNTVLILAAGLVEGLSAVHAAGVVHRDLKPSNVLLGSDGPRIIDFGISRSVGSVGPTRAGGIIGSPGFMSPEQALGEPVGPPADIFSLGSVLAFAATGEPPFGEGPPSALLYRAVHGEPAIRDLAPELRPLVARCLLADPLARPTTDELQAELGQAPPIRSWLDWLGSSEVGTWQATSTVPSQAWSQGKAAARDQSVDEMPSVPSDPDDDALPPVPADVEPTPVPAHVGEPSSFAPPGTSREERTPADAVAADAGLAPSPANSLSWVFPTPGDAPSAAVTRFRRDRTRRRAGIAGAGVLGAGILAALAIWLIPLVNPNPPAAGAAGRSGQSAPPTSAPSKNPQAGGGVYVASGMTPSEIRRLPGTERAAVTLVLKYFAAINERRLQEAWPLGGDDLYLSTTDLINTYANISHVAVTIIGVKGGTVLASLLTTYVHGNPQVVKQWFVVGKRAILATKAASAATTLAAPG